MAQFVGYFEDNVKYVQGPFVLCGSFFGTHSRIECERVGHHCPVVIDSSIYRLLEAEMGFTGGLTNGCKARLVDWLNGQVKLGRIVLDGPVWVCPEFVVAPRVES